MPKAGMLRSACLDMCLTNLGGRCSSYYPWLQRIVGCSSSVYVEFSNQAKEGLLRYQLPGMETCYCINLPSRFRRTWPSVLFLLVPPSCFLSCKSLSGLARPWRDLQIGL